MLGQDSCPKRMVSEIEPLTKRAEREKMGQMTADNRAVIPRVEHPVLDNLVKQILTPDSKGVARVDLGQQDLQAMASVMVAQLLESPEAKTANVKATVLPSLRIENNRGRLASTISLKSPMSGDITFNATLINHPSIYGKVTWEEAQLKVPLRINLALIAIGMRAVIDKEIADPNALLNRAIQGQLLLRDIQTIGTMYGFKQDKFVMVVKGKKLLK